MKNRITRMLSIGIALAAAVAVQAQNKGVTADVPFHFYVGSNLMPQGTYRVDGISNGTVARVSATQADASQAVATTKVMGKTPNEPARLVFHQFGTDYFLAEIWMGDGSTGKALVSSAREKELSRGAAPTLSVIRVALHR